MLNMEEIHKEIKKLEECNCTTYDVCKKLAILYIVRDHYSETKSKEMSGGMSSPMMMTK